VPTSLELDGPGVAVDPEPTGDSERDEHPAAVKARHGRLAAAPATNAPKSNLLDDFLFIVHSVASD
jgi:hypothetical protein